MAAATKAVNTPRRAGTDRGVPVAAGKVIFQGSLVCLDAAGNATPGAIATTLKGCGRANATIDNTAGAAGAAFVPVEAGIFRWGNDAGNPVTRVHIGAACYAIDDQTVSSSHNTNTRSAVGIVFDVDAGGVWVRIGLTG